MPIFQIAASIGLALWVGGLSLLLCVVSPVVFRSHEKEAAGRFMGLLLPATDRWMSVWGGVTVAALLLFFVDRHFEPRALFLELPVGAMFLLTVYCTYVLHPQIRDLKSRLAQPQFQGTAHLETIRFSFHRLHKRSLQLHLAILALGWFCLGLAPSFLE